MERASEPLLELIGASESGHALVCPDDGVAITYPELAAAVSDLAGGLRAAGVQHGDRVAVVLPNGPEIVALLFALAGLGATMAPLNPAYTEPEYRFFLDDLAPQLVLVGAGAAPAARAATGSIAIAEVLPWESGIPPRLATGNGVNTRGLAPNIQGRPDDVVLLLHTSGTTSRPKQVPLLQRNLTAQARSIARHYALQADDVSYCPMPLFHVHGLVASTLAQLGAGGTVVVPRRFSPRRFWSQARRARSHLVLGGADDAPDDPRPAGRAGLDAAFCPVVQLGALAAAAARRRGAARGADDRGLRHDRGRPPDDLQPAAPAPRIEGSVGIPAGADVRIVDAAGAGRRAGSGGRGGDPRAGRDAGYLNNERANSEAFFDGWFRTGDEGTVEDGYLHLRGRLKELIIRGGENISPHEVEAVLLAHPQVAEAVAFGIADDKYGQTVAAAVVLRGEATAEELRREARLLAGGVQGARHDPHRRRRSPRRPPARCSARGWRPTSRRRPGEVRRARRGSDRRLRGRRAAPRGSDVTLIARGEHLRAMTEHGVRVHSPRGDFESHPAATSTSPRSPTPTSCSWV